MVKSVRLACLMCAASVYPEPGSNSLFYFWVFWLVLINFFFYFLIFFWFTFWYFSISRKSPFGFFSKGFYCLLFNVLFSCSLGVNETYFSIPFSYCQDFFENIFKIFFTLFFRQNKKLVFDVFIIVLLLLFTNFLCIIF